MTFFRKRRTSEEEEESQAIIKHAKDFQDEPDEDEGKSLCHLSYCEKDYPKHIFFIISNEFCERFCYYGMRAILQTYLAIQLKLSLDAAGTLFHSFVMLAYFTPILGAIVADSYIGRYWAIFAFSVVYLIGNVIMAATSIGEGYLSGALIGMITIAIGTGGIKPCVSAFGADQFPPHMTKALESFFSLFYVSINLGALLSQFITPELKATSCFGQSSCWVLAFGLPAFLMAVALVLFLLGTAFYRRVPVTESVAAKFCEALYIAVTSSFSRSKQPVKHWLDRAVGKKISQRFVDDCKAVFKVLALFLPLPFFWALFDLQGSRWVYQAEKMDCYIPFLDWDVQPEQMQIMNSLMVVSCVPIFEIIIYPLFAKCNLLIRPLQRMVTGTFLSAAAFLLVAFLQVAVQTENDALIKHDVSTHRVRAFNLHDSCSFGLRSDDGVEQLFLQPSESKLFLTETFSGFKKITIVPGPKCSDICSSHTIDFEAKIQEPISSLSIMPNCTPFLLPNRNSFPDENEFLFQIQLASFTNVPDVERMFVVNRKGETIGGDYHNSVGPVQLNYTTLHRPGFMKLEIEFKNKSVIHSNEFLMRQGGAYTLFYGLNGTKTRMFNDKMPNAIHVFWQILPTFVITCGEIMFSITGISFAFSQAPASMKSILQAAWLLTVSFGNVIDIVVINIRIPDKAVEFFVFGIMMFVVSGIFAVMSYFYKYVDAIHGRKRLYSTDSEEANVLLPTEIEFDGLIVGEMFDDAQKESTLDGEQEKGANEEKTNLLK